MILRRLDTLRMTAWLVAVAGFALLPWNMLDGVFLAFAARGIMVVKP